MDNPATRATMAVLLARYMDITNPKHDFPLPLSSPFPHLYKLAKATLARFDELPLDKLGRQVGFIQGQLISHGTLKTNLERDFTRPMFHAAYAADGIPIPPTLEAE